MAGKPIKLNVADSQIMALRALKDLNKRLIIVETVCGFQEKWEGIKDRLQAVSKALDGIYKCDGLAAILLLAVRGVRARSARISIISLFSCFYHVTQITRISLVSLTHTVQENQCSNAHSIVTKNLTRASRSNTGTIF